MDRYLANGKLTIRAALYLNAFLISLVVGFSAPVTVVYFNSHISPELVATFAIVIKLCGIVVSYIKQSKVAIRYIAQNFIRLMLVCEAIFLGLALIGELHPEVRYIGYNLICVLGIKLLQVARKDNIVNCLKGTAIIAFNATCDTWGLVGSLVGSALCSVVLVFGELNVTFCMLLEFVGCLIGHCFQAYANKRIRRDIRTDLEEYTLVEAINDIFRVKAKKAEKKDDEDDSIFDQ